MVSADPFFYSRREHLIDCACGGLRGMHCNHLCGALRASSLYRVRFCSKAHLDVEIDQHGSLSLVIEECRPFIISPS